MLLASFLTVAVLALALILVVGLVRLGNALGKTDASASTASVVAVDSGIVRPDDLQDIDVGAALLLEVPNGCALSSAMSDRICRPSSVAIGERHPGQHDELLELGNDLRRGIGLRDELRGCEEPLGAP